MKAHRCNCANVVRIVNNILKTGKAMLNKKLVVVASVVLAVGLAAGGVFVYASSEVEGPEGGHAAQQKRKEPPVYVALESITANVQDPHGPRMVQLRITLVVDNAKTEERVKQFTPGIRNGLLVLLGEYSGEELLGREGKERLKKDIANAARQAMGLPLENAMAEAETLSENETIVENDKGSRKEPRKKKASPIQDVLFSSFIVQQ